MFRRNIIAIVLLTLIGLMYTSCTGDEVLLPNIGGKEQSPEQIEVSAGRLHNEILSVFARKHILFGEKLSRVDGTKLFIKAANEVFERFGCEFRIDKEFVDTSIAGFAVLKDGCGYDLATPGGNVEVALNDLEKRGILNPECAVEYRVFWGRIKAEYIDSESPVMLSTVEPVLMDPVLDVAKYSQEWWDNYIADMDAYVDAHPELRDWWDRWKKRVREWCLIGSDFIGGMLASPGVFSVAAGAALASIAFSIAWPPY